MVAHSDFGGPPKCPRATADLVQEDHTGCVHRPAKRGSSAAITGLVAGWGPDSAVLLDPNSRVSLVVSLGTFKPPFLKLPVEG
jgi:hypothetical protein